jgi:hypothetical protein
VARSKEKKRINLKKKKERNHKVTLNALTVGNKSITQKTIIRNPNKTEQPKQRMSLKIKNESLNRKSILKKSEIKPDDNLKKRLSLK